MSRPVCPRCGSSAYRRARRDGLLERALSVIYIYPFRCDDCFHRFRAMRWGKRYVRRAAV
jgi:hypothetical protein